MATILDFNVHQRTRPEKNQSPSESSGRDSSEDLGMAIQSLIRQLRESSLGQTG